MAKKNFFAILIIVFFLNACSSTSLRKLDFHVEQNPTSSNQIKQSELLHNYLTAELAYRQKNYEKAYRFYSEVRDDSESVIDNVEDRLAELNLLAGDPELALESLLRSIEENPDAEKFIQAAILYLSFDKKLEARQTVKKGIELLPNQEELCLYNAIQELLIESNSQVAIKSLNQCPSEIRTSVFYHTRARIEEYAANYQAAVKNYKKAFAKDPENVIVNTDLVRALLVSKQYLQAKKHLNSLKALDLKLTILKNKLNSDQYKQEMQELEGTVLRKIGIEDIYKNFNFDSAQNNLFKKKYGIAASRLLALLELFPEDSNTRFYLATAYSKVGSYLAAINLYLEIEFDNPLFVRSRILAALLYKKESEYENALEIILDALDQKPTERELWDVYTGLLRDQKDYSKLKSVLEDLMELFPGETDFIFDYAVVLSEQGRITRSIEVMEDLIQQQPDHADALNFVAYTYAEEEINLEKALEYVQRALKFDPNSPYYLDTLAWIYYKQNKFHEAKHNMELALKLLPEDPVLLEHYADILKSLGELNLANDYYWQSWNAITDLTEENTEVRDLKKRLEQKLKRK